MYACTMDGRTCWKNAGVTCKELAAQMGKNPKYISQVLNGHYTPKKAESEFNAAFAAIVESRSNAET